LEIIFAGVIYSKDEVYGNNISQVLCCSVQPSSSFT